MKIEAFKAWLRLQGAEVLAETNAYELVRFRAHAAVHVVYHGKRGTSWTPFAAKCYKAFEAKQGMKMGLTGNQRQVDVRQRAALLARDGEGCFYCGGLMPEDDMTLEHLVPRQKGGPNHQDNLALAHRACNQLAGSRPLVAKIKLREELRASSRCFDQIEKAAGL